MIGGETSQPTEREHAITGGIIVTPKLAMPSFQQNAHLDRHARARDDGIRLFSLAFRLTCNAAFYSKVRMFVAITTTKFFYFSNMLIHKIFTNLPAIFFKNRCLPSQNFSFSELAGVKFISILTALILAAGTAFSADGMRIAHIDSKLVFTGYKGTKKAQEEYDRQVAKWEQQANLLQKELASIKERLEKQSLMISEEQKRELEAEYARRDTELKNFIEKIYGRNGELLSENEKVSSPIIALIKKAVNEIALSEGYDYVLDRATGSVLFWKNENDITQKVLDYLNSR